MNLPALRDLIAQYFNDSELRDLCFNLGIDYDSLAGEGKSAKARELVAFMERRGRLPELVDICRKLRPKVVWPEDTQSALPARPIATTSPRLRASPDEERGLEELDRRLADADDQTKAELATMADQLRKNRYEEGLFGGDGTSSRERSRIIFALNKFALAHCEISFNDLCRI